MLGPVAKHANPPFHTAEYTQAQSFIDETQHANSMWGGVQAQVAPQLIGQYYFDTARPGMGQATMYPVSIDQDGARVDLNDSSTDPLQLTYAWNRQLITDTHTRGDQMFSQMQGRTPSSRRRGIANTFTRELSHPVTGESTNLIQFAYIPAYPTATQQKIAHHLANDLGAETTRRNYGNYLYWRNPNQSFRYATRK